MLRRRLFVTPSSHSTVALLSALLTITPVLAQTNRQTTPPPFGSQNQPGLSGMNPDRENGELLERLRRSREKDRQRRIVDDANRLVELTSRYRKALQEHETATPEDQKLLADIEKLAREVKDRMRGM